MKLIKCVKALTLAGLLLGSGVAWSASNNLNILNWSDYIGKDTVAQYEKATGVTVKYDVLDSDDTLQAKLLSGQTGYDVVYPSSTYMAKQLEAGVYEKLDWSKIPNRVNLDPDLMKKVAEQDPGNRYGVPYVWGTDGMIVNTTKVTSILGKDVDLAGQGWNLLFDPKVVSKLSTCGVSLVDSAADVFPVMLAYMGRDPNSTNPSDYEDAYKALKKIRPYVTQFSSTYLNDVAGGDVCIAFGWSGDAGVIKRRVREEHRSYQIRYLTPKGATGLWFTMMGIPKDAEDKDNAYKWLNFMLQPDVAAGVTNEITYPTAVPAAKKLIAANLVNDTTVYPTDDQLKSYFVFKPIDPDILHMINKMWLEFKAGR